MPKLDGRVALVTGGARGIGLEYALRLGSLGAALAVCDRDLKSSNAYPGEVSRLIDGDLERTLRAQGVDVMLGEFDAVDQAATDEFVDAVISRWGRIDVAVANAGGGGNLDGSFASQLDINELREIFDRNVVSAATLVRAVVPHMKKQGTGKIVTVASIAGVLAYNDGQLADYALAKAAVVNYTRYLAQELGPFGINVNAIAPGPIATAQYVAKSQKRDQGLDTFAQVIPMRRVGRPQDCANVLEFLATDLCDFVTGQVITVDGGYVRGAR